MKSEKGQSLVEFALILPVLVVLLLGVVDFGRVFHTYLTIDHAGREAARAASIGKSGLEAEQVAVASASSINLTLDHVVVNKGESGSDAEVIISYPFSFMTPFISDFFSGNYEINNTTVMRVE